MTNRRCDTCRCNKVCDHYHFGFENCGNYIPKDEVSELDVMLSALEEVKREKFVEDLKKEDRFAEKDGVTMITRLSGGIFLPKDSDAE